MKDQTEQTGVSLAAEIWRDDNKLRKAFAWLTRIGIAPKFGTLPIHYYQQDQCKAIDEIVRLAGEHGFGVDRLRYVNSRLYAFARVEGQRQCWWPFAMIVCGKLVMTQLDKRLTALRVDCQTPDQD